ncbi:hypothetical protein A1F97_10927 [Pyrenophora tritici-repentis]|uniref:Uncharacterized protein n=3 Tax=Pyrenophora tritici-repentis TaxID=45151 RepID=A0A2W1FC84_9PLEO|nr:hypothetical protein A1F99_058430 [Pyrenophora tritici-repentis]KAI0569369.1 hypothetical protein Alg215_11675 [Pyrenophora tritici-repentis]KAI1513912.1 hypothetical protein Ptr86124_006542 [Pyrenophora tritici-repentis]KAI1560512.1 hypothetical protein PtrEW7m1_011535 [Pyrenophora tritici-repentis]KAI1666505.1 hypothetical protein L13192_08749 [Pyrenophora tritici-repentis]
MESTLVKDRAEAHLGQRPRTTVNENEEIAVSETSIDIDDSDLTPMSMTMQPALDTNGLFQPSALQSWTQFLDLFEGHIFDSLQVPHLSKRSDHPPSQLGCTTSPDGTNGLSLARDYGHRPRMPSLREVRALNTSAQTAVCSLVCENSEQLEECLNMVSQLTSLCSNFLVTQMEVAGISSAVAEYLVWVHKGPQVPLRGATLGTSSAEILEILEARVRELQSMAETSHQAGWARMLKTLESRHSAMQLDALEEMLPVQMEKRQRLFQENYEIDKNLPEQLTACQEDD